ncbi:MAG: hypothetical protein FP814_02260 [Desulfobacterium sp.]|nr:hypothetical protein [Desulfobacterium sp.]MBU3949080.1 hypothetical protein [Pseudomonadota bacterium]MBU4009776.1 hypothetical protein [Pseudomonadota bacterium]MBU4037479.1 hypothetical protein [Pseudomonadota bacterium]
MAFVKDKLVVLWAYLAEVILAGLVYILSFLLWDFDQIASFFIKTSDSLVTKFTAIMLAGSVAFFWAFYSHSNTDFSKWLYQKKVFNTYLWAFLTAIAVFIATTIAFVITQFTQNKIAGIVSGGLFILSVINVFSFFKNIVGIMKLNIVFNIKRDHEKQKKE